MNRSRLFVLFLCLAVAVLAACDLVTERITLEGSGNLVTQEESISGFDKVRVSHSFQVSISAGDGYRVDARVDDNVQEYLMVEKDGDTLRIGLDPDNNYDIKDVTLEAEVTVPELTALWLSGSSDAAITGLSSSSPFEVDLSGSSTLRGDIESGDVNLDVSGVSSVSLTGSAGDATLDVSGSSDVDLSSFPVADANLDVSGSSDVTVNPSGTLNVDASGASDVFYLGNPTLGSIDTSGGASVEPK